MKRLVFSVILAIILAGLLLFVLSDTVISVADTSLAGSEVASGVSEQFLSKRYNYDYDVYFACRVVHTARFGGSYEQTRGMGHFLED